MNKDQGSGIIERIVYGTLTFLVLRYGAKFGLTPDDAAWLGGGAIALGGGVWAWWHNRPVSVLNRASEVIPTGAKLVIATPVDATITERMDAHQLADAANPKVVAK